MTYDISRSTRRTGRRLAVMLLSAIVLAIVLSSPSRAAAQTSGGSFAGIIADAQGGVLPGATITVRNADSGLVRTTVSEADGRYRVSALPPGRYDLTAELQGFSTAAVKDLTITVGLEFTRNVTLGLQGVQELVTVQAQTPIVETTKTEVGETVTPQEIETLPVANRSAITLALLVPGTSVDTTRAQRPGATVGLASLNTAGTNYIVDGMNNMISGAGDAREDVPQSAIQEFKVIVTQPPAEYGGRVGGVVNVVTKSGSNTVSGEGLEFFRDKALNRVDEYTQQNHDQLGTAIPNFRRDQYGGAIGGPIIKNRLHLFGSFERTDDQEYFTVNTGQPQDYSSLEGTFKGGSVADLFFTRADAQISQAQHAFFRYFHQIETYYSQGAGGNAAAFGATDTGVPGFSYIAGHTWVLSPRVLNEFTAMYAESYQTSTLSDRYTPSQYAGVGSPSFKFPSLSWGSSPGTRFRNVYEQFRDAVSVVAGAHTWKFGGGVQVLPTYQTSPGNPNGTWTFATDQYFDPSNPASIAALKNPTQFTATFPAITPENLSHTFEAYAQDEWRPRADLTLNLGVRYDLQTLIFNENFSQSRYPTPLPYVDFGSRGDHHNVAPRAGLAWDLRSDGQSVLRAGYGMTYVNLQNSLLDGEITAFQQYSITIKNASYPNPYQGKSPLAFASTAPPNITIGANDIVNPRAQTVSAGLSQSITPDIALHVDGVYSWVQDYNVRVNVNTPDPLTGVRPLPQWGQIVQLQPSQGDFVYRALLVRLDRRFAKRYLYTLSYTLSKQDDAWTGTDANANGGITNVFNPGLDQGPADADRRHNFVAAGSVLLPLDLNLGAVWTLRSSLPFSALAGKDLNNDGFTTDYVPGTSKNQGNRNLDVSLVNAWRAQNGLGPISASQIQTSRFNRVDVRLSKTLALGGKRLELIAQIFNLFGTDNLGGVGTTQVTNALSASFGEILTAQPRQQGELAVRFIF
ncbi:MAG TPA: carboxypeptidase regulatory-like domain-containing protein [Vicinamibacterales bacterium]|nr:carboxypeptidase regulatory-like domain-containing protein [Vicinamibacterales bacterium]